MTEIIKLPSCYNPDWEDARYGSLEELKVLLCGESCLNAIESDSNGRDAIKETIQRNC